MEEVCREFDISPATGRRDFSEVADKGLAIKTWGGLRRLKNEDISNAQVPKPFAEREIKYQMEKENIARKAASLVDEGDVIAIDGGTTTLLMADYLADKRIRILTNSLQLALRVDRLRSKPGGAEVFLTGGFLFPETGLLVGPQAVKNLLEYNVRYAFLSCGGMDSTGGMNTNQMVVESERVMIAQSEKAIVLADSSKWLKKDMIRAWEWREISAIITTSDDQSLVDTAEKFGVRLLTVKSE